MSLSNSRWSSARATQSTSDEPSLASPSASSMSSTQHLKPTTHPRPSSSKYLPPHLKPNSNFNSHQNANRKPSSDITLSPQDRKLSQKFSRPSSIVDRHPGPQAPSINQNDPKLRGLLNSFDRLTEFGSHPDPMSLTPSISRGINPSPRAGESTQQDSVTPGRLNALERRSEQDSDARSTSHEQDLRNLKFQVDFFKWILKKIESYRKSYPDSTGLFLRLTAIKSNTGSTNSHLLQDSDSNETQLKIQLDRISSLVRELRKLREGIFASGRMDSFAIVVYETSAELALESADFAQLNMILNHLIFGLYQHQRIDEHLLLESDSTNTSDRQGRFGQSPLQSPICKESVDPAEYFGKIMDRYRSSLDEIFLRRLMFAQVLLLLPIVDRWDLARFIDQFSQINRIFEQQRLSSSDHLNHQPPRAFDRTILGIATSHPKLFELGYFFKLLIRKNYAQLNRKFIKPLMLEGSQLCNLTKANGHQTQSATHAMIHWDQWLRVKFLDLFRRNLVWNIFKKAYYSMSLKDDLFMFNSLCLEFSFNHLNPTPDTHEGDDKTNDHPLVHQSVNDWLNFVDIQRSPDGSIKLKQK